MQMYSKVLIALSALALLLGAIPLVFAATVTRFAAADDVHLLTTRYNPNGDIAYQDLRTYDTLYAWTEHILHHRNHFALSFHCTLGAAFVIMGMLLIAWTVDREHLLRRLGTHKGRTSQDTAPGACS
ncbi:MAG: hypothetical protein ABFD90_15050 [Phycisphaerales bacterium]